MAVRLISEELNVNSSYHILKDMEEYFRINLRRNITGEFFLGIFNSEENSLQYSGCGNIKLFAITSDDKTLSRLELPPGSLTSKEFRSLANKKIDFPENSTAFIVSPAFSENCGEKISKIVNAQSDIPLKILLEKMRTYAEEECSQGFKDAEIG
jgi:hypothetical protein